MPGDEISQSLFGDENDDSERGKIWDSRSYLSLFGIASIDDSSEEGTKNCDRRECVSTRANDLYECRVRFAPPWLCREARGIFRAQQRAMLARLSQDNDSNQRAFRQ